MPIHFAAAASRMRPQLSPAQARAAVAHPANDNPGAGRTMDDRFLHTALRYFAQHGIGAAAHARREAERAFFAGDRETYRWWLSVCRTLDRRTAARLVRESEHRKDAKPQ